MPINKANSAERIMDIPLKTWDDIGDFIGNRVRHLIREDFAIADLKPYNRKYRLDKMAGKAGVRQASREGNKPNLTLTGKMLNNFRRLETKKDEVGLGFSINAEAMKAEENEELGRDYLHNDKILNPIANEVNQRIEIPIDANIRRWESDSVEITIG